MMIDFSVIVPTWNRPRQLEGCLRALAALDYPREAFEVIVVDDGGSPPLEALLERCRENVTIHLARQANAGPAAARNLGARRANGRHLAFTDDDCRPASDWLAALAARVRASPGAAISGHRSNAVTDDSYAAASQAITETVYAHFNRGCAAPTFISTSNLAVPADRFREVGGFDEGFRTAEDRDFSSRWIERGFPLVDAPEVMVAHCHGFTLATFWRRYFEIGRGARRFLRVAATRNAAVPGPDLAFYAKLLAHPFATWRLPRAMVIAGLVVLAQAANAVGYGWEVRDERRRSRLPGAGRGA
jgi:GT2 family glycosyltransferase